MIGAFVAPRNGKWRAGLGLALIAAAAAGLRFWRLDAIPPGFHFDEAYEALEAWRVITQPGYHPIFFPGNFGVEPMFIYLTSLAFRLFGETPAVMRGVAAVIGTATVLAVYGLGRELALNDRRFPMAAAGLAALALAIMRWHIFFSRVGIEPILVPLFLVAILWAFWRAWRTASRIGWAAAGLATGLSLYIYPAARLLPIIFLLLSLLALTRWPAAEKPATPGRPAQGVLIAWLVAGVIALPMAWNWLNHPDQLLLRSSQIAVGPGGAAPGNPAQNLLATLGMFSVQGDRDPRSNVPGMPALDLFISAPFILGGAIALWRWKRPVFASLLLAGLLMLAPTIFSEDAPHFRRAVGETPVTALFIGLGLAAILGRRAETAGQPAPAGYVPWPLREGGWEPATLAANMDRLRAWGRGLAAAVIVAGSASYSAVAYFDIWGRSNAIFYAYDQGLWEIGQYVLDQPADMPVYLSPRPEGDMTLAFAWRAGRTVRRFDGRHAFIAPASARPVTYIIIEHEDYRGAMLLRDLYPAAAVVKEFHDRSGKVYARAFLVKEPAQIDREPRTPAAAQWPDRSLVGYDIDKTIFAAGQKIFLQLWWRADAPITADWTAFTHVLGPPRGDGSVVWAGLDARPGSGSIPTDAWRVGDIILDEYQIALPNDMPHGQYQLEIGWYLSQRPDQRLRLVEPAGQDHFVLGAVELR